MEQIVFPVPNICEYLTEESKVRVFTTTERDDQGSKVNDFFQQFDDLYNEMRWQKKIRSGLFLLCSNVTIYHKFESVPELLYWCIGVFADNAPLFWVSKHISLWGSISFNLAVLINLAVALFYPFGDDGDEGTALILDRYLKSCIIMALWFPWHETQTESIHKYAIDCITWNVTEFSKNWMNKSKVHIKSYMD